MDLLSNFEMTFSIDLDILPVEAGNVTDCNDADEDNTGTGGNDELSGHGLLELESSTNCGSSTCFMLFSLGFVWSLL